MKKATLIATTLCAYLIVAGIASAQQPAVAGFSPNLADPQNVVYATLTTDANRLIRWQGWLDVDAFSISVINQMQKQLGNGIEIGKFTRDERSIYEAVEKAEKEVGGFSMDPRLDGEGVELANPTLYVWLYRHNFTDTGLYQFYVSVKGTMVIGKGRDDRRKPPRLIPHRDIQALSYEFGEDGIDGGGVIPGVVDIPREVEIWRGAVVRVNAKGEITVVGNEAGVITIDNQAVEKAPIVNWEKAPSLIGNLSYVPKDATGAQYHEPLLRKEQITENDKQKQAGEVRVLDSNERTPSRVDGVRTVPPERNRVFGAGAGGRR